jgi:putative Ca2+/H+ antiporter (TMEM165/GDT1 family)
MFDGMLPIFLTTYGAVFIAEIVGDKLLYTTGILSTRYRWSAVIAGMSLAFMGKMSVAVVVGAAIGKLLPVWLVALLTAFSFIGVAITMWRKPDVRKPKEKDTRILKGAMVAFATIFFSEWGDKGMVTAGTWAAAWIAAWHNATHTATGSTSALAATLNTGRLHELSLMQIGTTVWLASVMAMVTKGGLAVTLGVGIRTWIAAHVRPRYVRYAGVAALVVLGVLSVLEVLGLVTD